MYLEKMAMAGEPIFKSIFGEKSWAQMPPVMHAHYANRPFSEDVGLAEGRLTIKMSPFMKLMSPIFALTKTLMPHEGNDIRVSVYFKSEPDSNCFQFERRFHFEEGRELQFFSRMEPIGGNELIEWTQSNIGWHCAFSYEDGRVLLSHRGYCVRLFGKTLKLPLDWIMGRGSAFEIPVSESAFDMHMDINHPLWGRVYSYEGQFEMKGMTTNE